MSAPHTSLYPEYGPMPVHQSEPALSANCLSLLLQIRVSLDSPLREPMDSTTRLKVASNVHPHGQRRQLANSRSQSTYQMLLSMSIIFA